VSGFEGLRTIQRRRCTQSPPIGGWGSPIYLDDTAFLSRDLLNALSDFVNDLFSRRTVDVPFKSDLYAWILVRKRNHTSRHQNPTVSPSFFTLEGDRYWAVWIGTLRQVEPFAIYSSDQVSNHLFFDPMFNAPQVSLTGNLASDVSIFTLMNGQSKLNLTKGVLICV
jgi:hypothetical protein